jgi:3-hydroxyacyl-[acyl-carrier-protein] dehydratase
VDVNEIQKLIPHRFPFLLVDRVVSLEPGKKLTAYKNVTINEPFFQGHFPGLPVMPGVLIVEALAQAAALLAYKTEESSRDKVAMLMSMDNVKFRKPVVPGDRLQLDIEVVKKKGPIWKQKCTATVDGQKVAEAEIMAMVVDRNEATANGPVNQGAPSGS